MKCATHQAGLTARSSVTGRVAATGARQAGRVATAGAGQGELYKATAGALQPLAQPHYFEEFAFSAREWVVKDLVVDPAEAGEDSAATGAAQALQRLYTEHVVPADMLTLWNNGLGNLRHRLAPGQDPVAERPRVVNDFAQWIVKHLLHVDPHPTLNRFFIFLG